MHRTHFGLYYLMLIIYCLNCCYSVSSLKWLNIAFNGTHTVYVVFQFCGFYYVCPAGIDFGCVVTFRHWLPSWTAWHTWYWYDARQDKFRIQAALLWISKVWLYVHVCSMWSAKKNMQIPVIEHLSNLWWFGAPALRSGDPEFKTCSGH